MERRGGGTDRSIAGTHLSKTELRHRFAGLRDGKPFSFLSELGLRIAAGFSGSDLFLNASNIALYSPLGKEAGVSGVLADLTRLGKKAFFPRVCGNDLRFFEVSRPCELSPGSFGIAEPSLRSREIAVSDLDLMVVPGICFDRFGSRIGYGKGFYDRAIGDLKDGKVCAAAYLFQVVDFELPAEPHDRRVGFLVTEHGVFRAETKKDRWKND